MRYEGVIDGKELGMSGGHARSGHIEGPLATSFPSSAHWRYLWHPGRRLDCWSSL